MPGRAIRVLGLAVLLALPWLSPGPSGFAFAARPAIDAGVLELSGYNLAEKGPLRLDGPWLFYWGRFCLPGTCPRAEGMQLRVPGVWNDARRNGRQLPGLGFGTYTLRIKTGPQNRDLALFFKEAGTACKIFANGRLLLQSGSPGADPAQSKPSYRPGRARFHAPDGTVELTVWISNFHHWQGGLWEGLFLGAPGQIEQKWRAKNTIALVLLGAILVIGLYHLCMGLLRSQRLSHALWFGIFCLLIAVRMSTTDMIPLLAVFPRFPWPLMLGLIYGSFYLMVPVFMVFMKTVLPDIVGRHFLKAAWALGMVFTASLLVLPSRLYTLGMPAYQAITVIVLVYGMARLIKLARKGVRFSLLMLLSFSLLFVTGLNDILHSRQLIETTFILPWGVFAFVFAQAIIIAGGINRAFSTIEAQRAELLESNREIQNELKLREETENMLARERDYLKTITRAIGAGLVVISRDFRTIWANDVFKELMGDHVGETCYQAYQHRIEVCPQCGVQKVFQGHEGNVVTEIRARSVNGKDIWTETIATPIMENGEIVAALELVIPIDERKKAQLEKARLEDQLKQAQKMEAVGVLAGGVAHDFNNLLQIIKGSVTLAQTAGQGPDLEASLEQINRAAGRAGELVGQLLTFSRKADTTLAPMDLNREVSQTIGILSHTLPKMVEMQTELAEGLPPILGNPSQIGQVILNLAANASDAMPNGGRMVISTRAVSIEEEQNLPAEGLKPGPHVLLTVSDNGTGMPQEVSQHIFEPFFTTKEIGRGTGLGLSAVYGVAKSHGGAVVCQTSPGQGTSMLVYLPALQGAAAVSPEPAAGPGQETGGQETVLLVDDEEVIVKIASQLLAPRGYRVITANSGEQAISRFQAESPDLVVMDLGMPGMGGRRALARIISLDPAAKVIIASGYADRTQGSDLLREGARAYLRKPFELRELLATIRQVLDQGGQASI